MRQERCGRTNLHSAMHTETSDEVACIANVTLDMQFDESGATPAENMVVTVSKMQDSVEAHHQTSLKTAEDLDEGPFPANTSVRSRNDASGKTGSGKKFYHSVISGAVFTAQSFSVAINAWADWKLTRILHAWEQFRGLFQISTQQERLLEVCRFARHQPIGWQFSAGLDGFRQRNKRSLCFVMGDCTDIGSGTTCGPYSLAPCAHHVAPSTEYPVCPSSDYSTAVTLCIVHWSLLVVELGECNDPWSEL